MPASRPVLRPALAEVRQMQAVFTVLALTFLLPSLTYFFLPELAVAQFRSLGTLLGSPEYPFDERSHLWRILAFGNVFTLGTMVLMIQLDIRKNHALIPAFLVLKACSAFGYLWVFLTQLRYPVFLAVFLLDSAVLAIVPWLGYRALRAVVATDADVAP